MLQLEEELNLDEKLSNWNVVRCYTFQLHQVARTTQFIPEPRKLLRLNIPRLTAAARGDIRESGGNVTQLCMDLQNGPLHVFGEHKDCHTMYCVRKDYLEVNYVPLLSNAKIFPEIVQCSDILLRRAGRLTEHVTTNVAENYMSLVSKYGGGKRIDFSKSGAYQCRCLVVALYHYTGPSYIDIPWKMQTDQSPGVTTINIIKRRENRRAARRLSSDNDTPQTKRRKIEVSTNAEYEPDAAEIYIDVEEEMERRKKYVLDLFAEEVDCKEKCLLL
ncbi:hypothetical protein PR048_028251 [Dryococelus australis]|uniref:Uncharacterized protein n=1 Tax=Dryococelus australis TaxID=614101 RepID=A0ABQ9GIM9_9NEOP|nr:hypothetical protein PR048_028251 [Dryococelus australis]